MNSSRRQGDPTAHTRQRIVGLLFFLCSALVLLITLFPTAPNLDSLAPLEGLLSWLGVPSASAGRVLEAILNVLMFVPLGLLLVMLMPTLRVWWLAPVASAAISFAVELVQAVALAGRSASIIDFVTNSAGGAIGAVIGMLWLVARQRRRLRRPALGPGRPDDAG